MADDFLLTPADGEPVAVENGAGAGDLVLLCEHASNLLPARLGTLGLAPDALESHIAWDPGALAVARHLSRIFDAPLIWQRFSRLVYDCNRPPDSPTAMPAKSEIYEIPGNVRLVAAERTQRIGEIYRPFARRVAQFISARQAAGRAPLIATIHSFTPVHFGRKRDVEIGILHDEDACLADRMLQAAERQPGRFDVRRNQPYGPEDGVTHSLVEYGVRNGLPNVMIEIRNDLIRDAAGQIATAEYLSALLDESLPTGRSR